MQDAKTISALVGLIAGIAAALLLVSAHAPSSMAMVLIAAASLPILIAGLGWSNFASIIAVLTAAALMALMANPVAALSAALTSLAPAAWIAHLATLARPAEEIGGPEGRLAWYPLSDILFQICALMAAALVILGAIVGYGPELSDQMVDMLVGLMRESNAEFAPTADMIAGMKGMMLRLIPLIQGAIWVGILFAMFYVARVIVRISGRSRRPKDDVPSQLRMPRTGLWAFGAGVVLSFFSGPVELIGWVLVGTFGAGFILAGFALLHHVTRGKAWRPLAIWFAYLAVILFTLPLIVFLAFGLASTGRSSTMTPNGPTD